jgi:hypothetical protein
MEGLKMKFEEALVHLRAGKRIRCSAWTNAEAYLGYRESAISRPYQAAIGDILKSDWELYDEPEKYYQDGIELPTNSNADEEMNDRFDIARVAIDNKINKVKKDLDERISNLENSPFLQLKTYDPLFERLDSVELRLKEVERFQDITHEQYMSIARKEKPHKCPACDGVCFVTKPSAKVAFDEMLKAGIPTSMGCIACKGSGVLWK